ncbi:MAG: hypothetical protein CYG59_04320 [Chloroflexi bacterium]|nr:MAG: hypothetical protein CYG59_04320 [Chloroflexota bacterium]
MSTLYASRVHLAATQPEPSTITPPEQPVFFKRGIHGQYWITLKCVACGKKHIHGAGALGDDPLQFLGHRSCHCLNSEAPCGYVLVIATEDK